MKQILVALVVFAAYPEVYAVPMYQITGTFEDGGAFDGLVVPPTSPKDRCPDPGIGCFGFSEAVVFGEYAFGPLLASTKDMQDSSVGLLASFDYQLRAVGTDEKLIRFVFNASTLKYPEWIILADFEYFGSGSLDTPWDGTASAIGPFMGGYVDNENGYNSPISDARLAPASISAPPLIWMLELGMFCLIAIRRSRFTD